MAIKILRKREKVDPSRWGGRGRSYESIKIEAEGSNVTPGAWADGEVVATYEQPADWKKKPTPPDPKAPVWSAKWDESDDPHKADWRQKDGMTKAEAVSFMEAKVKEMYARRSHPQ